MAVSKSDLAEKIRACGLTPTAQAGTKIVIKLASGVAPDHPENIGARKIKELSPNMGTLRIADSNYGMYERDTEISSYLGETQKLYGWPSYIDATTGKNRPDRIIKSLEQVNGAMVLYQAVQRGLPRARIAAGNSGSTPPEMIPSS